MHKPPAFQLYCSDFDMDTASWTCDQVGAYLRLLMYEWVNGSLPTKITHLARIARVDPRNMQKMWSAELAKKFTMDDANMYVNLRLERTREDQAKFRKSQAEKGRKRAEKMWEGHVAGASNGLQPEDSSSSSSLKKDIIDKSITSFPDTSEPAILSQLLFAGIQNRDPKAKKPDIQKWCEHIDKLIRIDGRSPGEIREVILWCQTDAFWCNNILSTNKLREKFQALILKMKGGNGNGSARTGGGQQKAPGTAGLAKTDDREYRVTEY